jgi:hypothetical protein
MLKLTMCWAAIQHKDELKESNEIPSQIEIKMNILAYTDLHPS